LGQVAADGRLGSMTLSKQGVKRAQAAVPSDFETEVVADLAVDLLVEESAVADEEESADEPPDSLDLAATLDEPESWPESLPALLWERPCEPFRESFRESVR